MQSKGKKIKHGFLIPMLTNCSILGQLCVCVLCVCVCVRACVCTCVCVHRYVCVCVCPCVCVCVCVEEREEKVALQWFSVGLAGSSFPPGYCCWTRSFAHIPPISVVI